MAGRFSVEAVFKAVDKMTAPISRMQNRINKMTRGMSRQFERLNRNVESFGSVVKKSALAATASLAITSGAMANVISTGANFEQTLVNAAAKFPGEIRKGTKAFEELEKAARKTGAMTEFSASEAASALNFLAMAGFDSKSAVAALPGVVNLATAAQVDLATATDVASDSLGAFGLMTKDSVQLGKNLARVNDVIAKTTTTANTTVESLFETIKDGGPVATTAGASLETFSALAGELANAGIKGTQAGTTLKNMFLTLSAPTAGAAKILKKFGIQTKDANGDMRDIVDILGDLNKSLDGLGTADRSGVLEGIFGKIPIAGVNVLLASGSEKLNAYRKQLEAASGASTEMASVMRNTLQGRLNSLNSAVENVKISIFSMTSGPLSDAIEKTTQWVRANEKLIATNVGEFLASIIRNFENIVTVGKKILMVVGAYMALTAALKVAAGATLLFNLFVGAGKIILIAAKGAIKAYTLVMGKLPKVLASARAAMLALNLAFAANPIGLIVMGVLLFIGLAATLIRKWKPVTEFFNNLGDKLSGIGDKISNVTSKVSGFLGFGDDEDEEASKKKQKPQMISPQERTAQTISEQRTTSTSEVTIKDETGRAEITKNSPMGALLSLQSTGAFE